ncbi:hypothetical protein AB0H76_17115 [Nocardia sp. NPDC050712]|uniref:hypothetical protein n=1 Tax=Nocardia sp. NPDC050712 TaxID=3155518 RepID=UPI0033E24385
MFGSKRTAATAATTFGAMAAALVMTAPSAPAWVTGISVAPGLSFGTSTTYGTSCPYTVTANATWGDYVYFYDYNGGVFSPTGPLWVGASGSVTAQWTPYVRGSHTLVAWGQHNQQTTTVTVGSGTNVGFGCVVLP